MARPQEYSDEEIIAAIQQCSGMISNAAILLGCDPSTIHIRARNSKEVKQAIFYAREAIVDIAEQKLKAAIEAGEPWAIKLALLTLGRRRGYDQHAPIKDDEGDKKKKFAIRYVN